MTTITFIHPNSSASRRTFAFSIIVLVHLALALGLVWALPHPVTRSQTPEAVPVPTPPQVVPTALNRALPSTQPWPEPAPVPTPPVVSTTLAAPSVADHQVPEPFTSATARIPEQVFVGAMALKWNTSATVTGLLVIGLLAWVWLRRSAGFRLRSFNR